MVRRGELFVSELGGSSMPEYRDPYNSWLMAAMAGLIVLVWCLIVSGHGVTR
jgi:hypothetical protein